MYVHARESPTENVGFMMKVEWLRLVHGIYLILSICNSRIAKQWLLDHEVCLLSTEDFEFPDKNPNIRSGGQTSYCDLRLDKDHRSGCESEALHV